MINYEAIEVIHKSPSGKSVILKVKDKNRVSDNIYVLKIVAGIDNNIQRLIFKREIEALKVLNNCEDIVRIYDNYTNISYGQKSHCGGILLDFVHGCNIDEVNLANYSQVQKYQLCLKILYAVSNAHNNDVIHRDLKPSNIMYDELTGRVRIIDFGSSKIKSIIESETTMPQFSENYSAPEILKGNDITEACDIYSLGAVFFKIIFNFEPKSSSWMIQIIEDSSLRAEIKELLIGMLQEKSEDRISDISEVIYIFKDILNDLNPGSIKCNICVDNEKLGELKRRNVIQREITMAQFTNSVLKRDFSNCSAHYDVKRQLCILTGTQFMIESSYDERNFKYDVVKIREVNIDRRNRNQKMGFRIDGSIKFVDSRFSSRMNQEAGNRQLWVMLQNHLSESSSIRNREELFNNLFGEWQKGIEEAIKNEKEKVGKIVYSSVHIEGNELIVKIDDYLNKSIDELNTDTRYIIEEQTDRKSPFYYTIGNYSQVVSNGDDIEIHITLLPNLPTGKIKALLRKKSDIMEDFRANISSYRKQIKAIKSLHDDDCSARNLKDIVLNIEEPVSIPRIATNKYFEKNLNPSQKEAVRKALESDCLSLIQGPPGTGKTKVIKEIIAQIVNSMAEYPEPPKILVVSQSHTAVDNILEGLSISTSSNIDIIRIGKEENITSQEVVEKYTMHAIRDDLYESIRTRALEYLENKEELYKGITDTRELDRWKKMKSIQKDWLERCGDFEVLDYQVIRNATIIAGTCIGFLGNEYIREMEFDYVIVDEAAKATTPELLVSIIRANKIILVGDQNQLPAYADSNVSPLLAQLTKEPKYRLFDLLFDNLLETHKQILTTQYRMKRNIGNLISSVFYDNTIDTGINDEEREHGIKKYEGLSILWFDTSKIKNHNQKKIKGGSYINKKENDIIKEILDELKQDDELIGLDIGIITGYSGQKEQIKKMVQNCGYNKIAKQIDVNTLDAFQGRENDIIIYSTVRTQDSIGFQKERERVNVAFSRARKLLIICGDIHFFYNYDNPDNKFIEIIDYLYEHDSECQIFDCSEGGQV